MFLRFEVANRTNVFYRATKVFSILITVIVASNIFWAIGGGLLLGGMGKSFLYTSKDGTFVFEEIPSKGRDLKMMTRWWWQWKGKSGCNENECIIYRAFQFNGAKFWLWHEYLFHPRWSYPYLKKNQNDDEKIIQGK